MGLDSPNPVVGHRPCVRDNSPLIREVSRCLQVVLDCEKTSVVQFAQPQNHPHVHVIPRARDLPVEQRDPGIFSRMGTTSGDVVSADRMNDIAVRLSAELRIPF